MTEINNFEIEGKEKFQKGKYKEAAKLFNKAANEYQEKKELVKSAEMFNNQSVALLQAGKNKQAYEATLGTDEIFLKNNESLLQALAIGNKASALKELKRFEEAEKSFIECIAILEELGEQQYISDVKKSLSTLRLLDGRQIEAAATLKSSLDLKEKPTIKDKFMQSIIKKLFKKFQ